MDEKLGATGDFPRGKLNSDDEGGLRLAVAADPKSKTVIIEFGKPTAWLGLDVQTARTLAASLLAKADSLG